MNEAASQFLFFGMSVSLIGFFIGTALKRRFKLAIFNPLPVAAALVIILLVTTKISYATYMQSAQYLSYLLTPATVCLAIPLYRQLHLLRRYGLAIFAAILTGVLLSLLSVCLLGNLFGLDVNMIISLLPKSITTAIGMGLSEELGGYATITVAAIILTGTLGNVAGPWIFLCLRITDPVAMGLAIGTGAHAIGTAKAMEMGEVQGAMSSLALSVAGICTVPLVMVLARVLR